MQLHEPVVALLDALQRGFPCLLQLCCDQAVVRVTRGIAAFGQRCIVLGLGQFQLGNTQSILSLLLQHSLSLLCSLDRQRRHGAQHLDCNRVIDAPTAEYDAASMT